MCCGSLRRPQEQSQKRRTWTRLPILDFVGSRPSGRVGTQMTTKARRDPEEEAKRARTYSESLRWAEEGKTLEVCLQQGVWR